MNRPTPISDEAQLRRRGEMPYQWRLRRMETMRDLERKLADANAALKAANSAPHATELARIGELVGMGKNETVFGAVQRIISDSTPRENRIPYPHADGQRTQDDVPKSDCPRQR